MPEDIQITIIKNVEELTRQSLWIEMNGTNKRWNIMEGDYEYSIVNR